MTLNKALSILVMVHTRDDDNLGFQVMIGARPNDALISGSEYLEAWRVVRDHLGMPTKGKSDGQ